MNIAVKTLCAFFQKSCRQQIYDARYDVSIRNCASKKQHVTVLIPVPSDTPYQLLAEQPSFIPASTLILRESLYGNRYAPFDAELQEGELIHFIQSFNITVVPRIYKHDDREIFSISDYHKLNLSDYEKYLAGDSYSDPRDERIRAITSSFHTRDVPLYGVLKQINEYVIANLCYGHPIPGLYSSQDALERNDVDCGGFDTLFIALCRACGIPSRLVCGFWAGHKLCSMHAWVEILLPNGEWIVADPSIENFRRKGKRVQAGALGFAGSDRIVFSVGCDMSIPIDNQTLQLDILQNPHVFAENGDNSIQTIFSFTARRI